MGVCHYARYINVITALGSASGYESGMIRDESVMDLGTDQIITLSVKLDEEGFGARPCVETHERDACCTYDIARASEILRIRFSMLRLPSCSRIVAIVRAHDAES